MNRCTASGGDLFEGHLMHYKTSQAAREARLHAHKFKQGQPHSTGYPLTLSGMAGSSEEEVARRTQLLLPERLARLIRLARKSLMDAMRSLTAWAARQRQRWSMGQSNTWAFLLHTYHGSLSMGSFQVCATASCWLESPLALLKSAQTNLPTHRA